MSMCPDNASACAKCRAYYDDHQETDELGLTASARRRLEAGKCAKRIGGKRCKGHVQRKPAHSLLVCTTCGASWGWPERAR